MHSLDERTLKLITAAIRGCAYNSYIEGQKYTVDYIENDKPKDHNLAIDEESTKCLNIIIDILKNNH